MLAKLDEIRDHPIVKVKLGFPRRHRGRRGDARALHGHAAHRRQRSVDAGEAVAKLAELARYDIEFCEQPIPAGTPERLRWIRERTRVRSSPTRIRADARDLPALAGCVDGVNVKLVKCGGIRARSR
jgi:L-alanine-DL-glutamate epimerase-like enolase superfamily enzyme